MAGWHRSLSAVHSAFRNGRHSHHGHYSERYYTRIYSPFFRPRAGLANAHNAFNDRLPENRMAFNDRR